MKIICSFVFLALAAYNLLVINGPGALMCLLAGIAILINPEFSGR